MVTNQFMITEGVHGYFHYHISYVDTFSKSLCGKNETTMWTDIPMDTWGFRGHLKERYCKECKEIYEKITNEET
jgi:hypothetical protein